MTACSFASRYNKSVLLIQVTIYDTANALYVVWGWLLILSFTTSHVQKVLELVSLCSLCVCVSVCLYIYVLPIGTPNTMALFSPTHPYIESVILISILRLYTLLPPATFRIWLGICASLLISMLTLKCSKCHLLLKIHLFLSCFQRKSNINCGKAFHCSWYKREHEIKTVLITLAVPFIYSLLFPSLATLSFFLEVFISLMNLYFTFSHYYHMHLAISESHYNVGLWQPPFVLPGLQPWSHP